MKRLPTLLLLALPLLVGGVALVSIGSAEPDVPVLTGVVEVEEVDVVPKIPGRIASLDVREGERVAAGQVVGALTSDEIRAKVRQAEAAVAAAQAQLAKARAGARPEEIEAVRRQFEQAQSQLRFAEQSFGRVQNVYEEGVVSAQERDQARFKYEAARDQAAAAQAQLDIARQGARTEDVEAARAQAARAEAALAEARAYENETRLVSPVAGEVVERLVAPGEVVPAGFPILTVIDPAASYLILQVREDQLGAVRMGAVLQGVVPALGEASHPFAVTYVAAMADFATWRATNERGDFDLKTFEVRLRPAQPIEGLRPGMTVRVTLEEA